MAFCFLDHPLPFRYRSSLAGTPEPILSLRGRPDSSGYCCIRRNLSLVNLSGGSCPPSIRVFSIKGIATLLAIDNPSPAGNLRQSAPATTEQHAGLRCQQNSNTVLPTLGFLAEPHRPGMTMRAPL